MSSRAEDEAAAEEPPREPAEQRAERLRRELDVLLGELRTRGKRAFDLRYQMKQHPALVAGAGALVLAGVGLMVAQVVQRQRRKHSVRARLAALSALVQERAAAGITAARTGVAGQAQASAGTAAGQRRPAAEGGDRPRPAAPATADHRQGARAQRSGAQAARAGGEQRRSPRRRASFGPGFALDRPRLACAPARAASPPGWPPAGPAPGGWRPAPTVSRSSASDRCRAASASGPPILASARAAAARTGTYSSRRRRSASAASAAGSPMSPRASTISRRFGTSGRWASSAGVARRSPSFPSARITSRQSSTLGQLSSAAASTGSPAASRCSASARAAWRFSSGSRAPDRRRPPRAGGGPGR